MLESFISKITQIVVSTFRALGAANHPAPWLAPAAILALFLVL
jgi:hypothetical protein